MTSGGQVTWLSPRPSCLTPTAAEGSRGLEARPWPALSSFWEVSRWGNRRRSAVPLHAPEPHLPGLAKEREADHGDQAFISGQLETRRTQGRLVLRLQPSPEHLPDPRRACRRTRCGAWQPHSCSRWGRRGAAAPGAGCARRRSSAGLAAGRAARRGRPAGRGAERKLGLGAGSRVPPAPGAGLAPTSVTSSGSCATSRKTCSKWRWYWEKRSRVWASALSSAASRPCWTFPGKAVRTGPHSMRLTLRPESGESAGSPWEQPNPAPSPSPRQEGGWEGLRTGR